MLISGLGRREGSPSRKTQNPNHKDSMQGLDNQGFQDGDGNPQDLDTKTGEGYTRCLSNQTTSSGYHADEDRDTDEECNNEVVLQTFAEGQKNGIDIECQEDEERLEIRIMQKNIKKDIAFLDQEFAAKLEKATNSYSSSAIDKPVYLSVFVPLGTRFTDSSKAKTIAKLLSKLKLTEFNLSGFKMNLSVVNELVAKLPSQLQKLDLSGSDLLGGQRLISEVSVTQSPGQTVYPR